MARLAAGRLPDLFRQVVGELFPVAPTSVDVIDFATENEFQRVVGLCGAT
jgi:hypothetical protein